MGTWDIGVSIYVYVLIHCNEVEFELLKNARMERLHGSIQERLERLEKQQFSSDLRIGGSKRESWSCHVLSRFGQADDRRAKETEAF